MGCSIAASAGAIEMRAYGLTIALLMLGGDIKTAAAGDSTEVMVTATAEAYRVNIGGTIQLTAAVEGTADQRVRWSIVEGPAGGSISNSGAYTAPLTPGEYHLLATSLAATSKTAQVTITVFTVR